METNAGTRKHYDTIDLLEDDTAGKTVGYFTVHKPESWLVCLTQFVLVAVTVIAIGIAAAIVSTALVTSTNYHAKLVSFFFPPADNVHLTRY